MNKIKIGNKFVGENCPFYTIAEIGSNFDKSIKKAYRLIDLAKEAGADAVKFQTFSAESLVSKTGFENYKIGYQSKWKKSVFEVYKDAEFPLRWHKKIFNYCLKKKIDFFSAPYDKVSVDLLDKIGVPAFKIGSGDITWLENIEYIAKKNKPIILATGASKLSEVSDAVKTIKKTGNNKLILLQCVTNYPATYDNINLKVLNLYKKKFNCLVGYSDHTSGSSVAIGTVALGGCMIEKHFTDNKNLSGPDHSFAMDSKDFKKMVMDIRHMEKILGNEKKKIYNEEKDQYLSMKRSIRAKYQLKKGNIIKREDVEVLRPCEPYALKASFLNKIIGKKLTANIKKGLSLKKKDIDT